MGAVRIPDPVLLFTAALFAPEVPEQQVLALVRKDFGPILTATGPFPFDFSDYYQEEMGSDLKKNFIFIDRLIDSEELVEMKLKASRIEQAHAVNGNRRINLDPGYLEIPKLVLASTKNYSHRIHLGKGIYGDVQLFVRGGQFRSNPWTYPDYKLPAHLDFFMEVRSQLQQRINALGEISRARE